MVFHVQLRKSKRCCYLQKKYTVLFNSVLHKQERILPVLLMSSEQNLRLYHISGCQIGPSRLHSLQTSKTAAFLKAAAREDSVFKQVPSQKEQHIISPEVEDPVRMAVLYLLYEFVFSLKSCSANCSLETPLGMVCFFSFCKIQKNYFTPCFVLRDTVIF